MDEGMEHEVLPHKPSVRIMDTEVTIILLVTIPFVVVITLATRAASPFDRTAKTHGTQLFTREPRSKCMPLCLTQPKCSQAGGKDQHPKGCEYSTCCHLLFHTLPISNPNETTAGLDHVQDIAAIVSVTCNAPRRELAG